MVQSLILNTKSQSLRNYIHSSSVIQVHSVLNKTIVTRLHLKLFTYASVPTLIITLSQLGMRNLKIQAFKNQRIIFLVEFLSVAKLYSSACLFTWNFTPQIISIKIKWKRIRTQEKIARLRVLFDWHVIQNSHPWFDKFTGGFSTGKFAMLHVTKVPRARVTYNWEGSEGLWESLACILYSHPAMACHVVCVQYDTRLFMQYDTIATLHICHIACSVYNTLPLF